MIRKERRDEKGSDTVAVILASPSGRASKENRLGHGVDGRCEHLVAACERNQSEVKREKG